MRFDLKIPNSKSRLLANGKRGLQNPNYHAYQLFL